MFNKQKESFREDKRKSQGSEVPQKLILSLIMIIKNEKYKKVHDFNRKLNGDQSWSNVTIKLAKSFQESAHNKLFSLRGSILLVYKHIFSTFSVQNNTWAAKWYQSLFEKVLQLNWQERTYIYEYLQSRAKNMDKLVGRRCWWSSEEGQTL